MLRALQEREVERLGGDKTVRVDVRVIAATNKPLEAMVESGEFRQDLYYRLNIVPIFLLPLRERKEDLFLISNTLLANLGKPKLKLTKEAKEAFQRYDWPGNIRELQNVLEYAAIICDGKMIRIEDLPAKLVLSEDRRAGTEAFPRIRPMGGKDLKSYISEIEKDLILQTLEECGNNRSRAMESLGLSRRSFYDKQKKYGVDSPQDTV